MIKQQTAPNVAMREKIEKGIATASKDNILRATRLVDLNSDLTAKHRTYWINRATLEYSHIADVLMFMRYGGIRMPSVVNKGPDLSGVEAGLFNLTRELKGLRRDVKQGPRSIRQRLIDFLK